MTTSSSGDRYDAFLSYSHAADGKLAPELQRGMQRLAKKVFQRRALRMFRDETGLSTNPHLWTSIETALDGSEWFVLLASPESASSQWVSREVATWIERKPLDHLLIVMTDGEIAFAPDGRPDRTITTCLPETLMDALDTEPRWLDLRWARSDTQLDLRNGRFRAAVADLAAPIHGVAKDDLEGEDVRQQRRARRLAITGVALVGLLAVVSMIAAVVAVQRTDEARAQRNVARSQRNVADAKSLAAQAVAFAPTDVDLSLLLATEGQRRNDSLDTETGLLTALNGARHNVGFIHGLPTDVSDVGATPDRSVIYILTVSGDLQAWDPAAWTPVGEPLATKIDGAIGMDISDDGHRLVYGTATSITVIDLESGATVGTFDGDGHFVSISTDGTQVAAASMSNTSAQVWNADEGTLVAEVPVAHGTVLTGFLPNGHLLVGAQGDDRLGEYSLETPAGTLVHEAKRLPGLSGLTISPDGSWIATGGIDGSAVLIESDSFEVASGSMASRGSRVNDMSFSPDSRYVAISGDDGSVAFFAGNHSDPTNPDSGGSLYRVTEITGLRGQTFGEFTGRDRVLVVSATDGQAIEADVQVSTSIGPTTNHLAYVSGVAVAGDQLLTTFGGRIRLSPVTDPAAEVQAVDVGYGTESVAVDAGSGVVAVAGYDVDDAVTKVTARWIKLLRLTDLSEMGSVDLGSDEVRVAALSFSPDGSQLAVGFLDGRLGIYDGRSGHTIKAPFEVDTFPLVLGTVVWTPDGKRLFTGGQDGVLRTFDTATWSSIASLSLVPAQYALRKSTLSSDGRILVVPSESGEVFLVDATTGQLMGAPLSADGTALQVAMYTNDMRWIAALSRDGAVRIWDASTRRPIGPAMEAHDGYADNMVAYGTEQLISGGQSDGHVVVWNLDPASWSDRACDLAGRNLTRDEWSLFVGGEYEQTCSQWPAAS